MEIGYKANSFHELVDFIAKWGMFIVPLLVIEFGLLIFVIIDIIRKKKTKNLNPLAWIIISILFCSTFIGPVLYIIFGRAEAEVIEDDNDDI